MPLSIQDIFDLPYYASPVRIALEPARSAVQSLLMLTRSHHVNGVADWVINTFQRMNSDERKTNRVVLLGLYYVVLPAESWNSFPAYVDHLASTEPEVLVDKMLDAYERMSSESDKRAGLLSLEEALTSADNYLTYLRQRFAAENVDEEIERMVFDYVSNPPALRQLVVDHLRRMWDKYLAVEWARVLPMLQEVVRTYQRMDLKGKSFNEATRLVTGQDLDPEKWENHFAKTRRIIFVPHPHAGPYLPKCLSAAGELIIFFGAHLPEGIAIDTPDLSRTEIFIRMSALADDTRLRILRYISEHGEQRSQEIMEALNLSQSAASRHLTQLSTTGFLIERRCDGAKCYALDPERITDTLQAIANFLLISERSEHETPGY